MTDDGGEAPAADESTFLRRLSRGEAGAFRELVEEHQHRVFGFCARMLGDREEAVDLVQDVFVSVHAHVAGFRGESSLATWILRIARNHCLNRLKYLNRRGRRRSEELSEAELSPPPGSARQPDEVLEGRREREALARAIAGLDEEQRTLVVLRDIEGLSYGEIVAITELPEGTVKSRLHRARERLADALGDFEPGGGTT